MHKNIFNQLFSRFCLSLIFAISIGTLPGYAQAEDIDKITGFSHYRQELEEVLTFTVTAVGRTENILVDLNDLSKTKERPVNTTFAIAATRFVSNPDIIFYIPVIPQFATSEPQLIGRDKNKRPIFTTNYKFGLNLYDHNKSINNAYGFANSSQSVKNWKIPSITDPDKVQILLFLSFADAEKGQNVKVVTVPAPGKEGLMDGFSLSEKAIPGTIVFGFMFVAIGLAGAATGAGASVTGKATDANSSGENTDNDTAPEQPGRKEDDEKGEEKQDETEDLEATVETDRDFLFAGNHEDMRLSVILSGNNENSGDILNHVTLIAEGAAAEFINIEDSHSSSGFGYKSFNLSFSYKLDSEFYSGDTGLGFPNSVSIKICAPENLKLDRSRVDIALKAPDPEIHLNQKSIVIAEGSSEHPKIKAWVVAVDEGEWEFSVQPVADIESAIADAKCQKVTRRECNIKIKAEKLEEGAGQSVSSELQVFAKNKETGKTAKTTIVVTTAKEGLILVSQTPIRIAADGETESEIAITAVKAFGGKLQTDFDLLSEVFFSTELVTSSQLSAKAFATSRLMFKPESFLKAGDDCWRNLRGFSEDSLSSFVYKVKTSILLPGQGESYYATATLGDRSGTHQLKIPLMLDVDLMQVESRAWEIELERCRKIIARLPDSHRKRMDKFLDQQARFLGAKGLYELRRKTWKMAMALWEAEGLSGYEDVERWAGYIENTLDFAQWSGRMATDFLLTNKLKMGVFAAMAAGEIYDLVLSGIQAYRNDKSFDQWLEESFWKEIKDMFIEMGATALDPDKFVAKFSNNKKVVAIAWSVQFGYHFIANLSVHKLSVIEAAKKAAITVATAAALKFLAAKASAIAKKKGIKPEQLNKIDDNLDDAAEKGWKQAKDKVAGFEDAIKSGDKKAIKQKLLDIQSDKFALKEINKWPKEVRVAYNKELGKIYASIDKRVKKKIIQDLKAKGIHVKSKDLKMTNATNASKKVKAGSDRDISVEYKYTDKFGKTMTVDYPKEKLRDVYGRELYRSVGHKNSKDLLPDELMDKYDQYAIDSKDAEAYGRKKMNYENGKMENRDFNKIMDKSGLPEKLEDGTQIGMTAAYKGKHWFNKAVDSAKSGNLIESESFKMEGMSQLVKQYKNIYKPRRSLLDMMGKKQADDSKMSKLIGLMEKAVNLKKSPSYVEKLVKNSGFSSLNEFADSFGGRISAMNSMID